MSRLKRKNPLGGGFLKVRCGLALQLIRSGLGIRVCFWAIVEFRLTNDVAMRNIEYFKFVNEFFKKLMLY